jgi:mRNA interferase HigB
MLYFSMRIIAQSNLTAYGRGHPDAEASLREWINRTRVADWKATSEVQAAFPKAKVLNGERVRFEVAGGKHRLIAAIDFEKGIAFVKFIGTHTEYDRVDALSVSLF